MKVLIKMQDEDTLFSDRFQGEISDLTVELGRVEDLAQGVGKTLSRSLRTAIVDGRSFKSILGDIGKSFADIALKAAFKPIGTLASGLVESLFTATNPTLGNLQPFAKGGVVSSPSYFPISGGMGVAGEAGPEAILPLQRGADGRLGVGNAGRAISISVNVQASDARSFVGAEAEMSAMLLRAVRRGSRSS